PLTPGLVQSGLYQQRLTAAGIETLVPDPPRQTALMDQILCFKDTGNITPLTNIARRICRELVDKGTEAIAYACTEVPLALAGQPPSCPFYDTLDVLASACIREAQKEQGSEP
ncbi:aspartate/glutamate racemase family protein, partial [Verrucomicrobiota bacterium]